jgi:Ca2+-binding RTX toxin-like protein
MAKKAAQAGNADLAESGLTQAVQHATAKLDGHLASKPGWWPAATLKPRPGAEEDGMAVTLQATATAVGTASLAVGTTHATVITRGMVTMAYGTAEASATAASPAGETAFGTAQTGVAVSGADLVLSSTVVATGSGTAAGTAWSTETSTTSFLALDVLGYEFTAGGYTVAKSTTVAVTQPPPLPTNNTAVFGAAVEVQGDSTLVDVQIEALTVEDQFSTVSIQATGVQQPEDNGADRDRLVLGSESGNLLISLGGDDWVLGLGGNDIIMAGGGDNTALGGAGSDLMIGLNGDDWFFGGVGHDTLTLGHGRNIGFGGAGNDIIDAGNGDDALSGGAGDDRIDAGAGNNTFLLGGEAKGHDGNDSYAAGKGADWYILMGELGQDRISGFSVTQGDRLVVAEGDWDSPAGLAALNGPDVTLTRNGAGNRDLVVDMAMDDGTSKLTLVDFFGLNKQFASTPNGVLGDARAVPILDAMFVDADTHAEYADRSGPFVIGEFLSMIG